MSSKRGAAGPLSGSSDEEDEEKERILFEPSNVVTEGKRAEPYITNEETRTSLQRPPALLEPRSGTLDLSESICTMPVSLNGHVRQVCRPKQKKKKSANTNSDGSHKPEPVPLVKTKQRRDCLPMRMRALPQSFWQQPNHPHNISPAALCHRVLPPLSCKDSGQDDDIETLRPVSPPNDKDGKDKEKPKPRTDRNLTVGNTDLLYKLFENIEEKKSGLGSLLVPFPPQTMRRGRPKRTPSSNKSLLMGEDPYLVETVTAKLFPHLSIDGAKSSSGNSSFTSLGTSNVSIQLITIREGDKCVTLPSLCVEQNYSQMLSELASHI